MGLFLNRDHIWNELRTSRTAQPFLLACSALYSIAISVRAGLYQTGILKSQNPAIPTICVGNISVGGTGKTPLVAYLAKELSANSKVGILTRGYGSQLGKTGPHLAQSSSTAAQIGDEAKLYQLLLNEQKPYLAISADRITGVKMLKEAGADICIMDDGLQHFRISPDIKLCLIDISDAKEYFKSGLASLLPAGIFREPLEGRLSKIDRVVFTCKTKVDAEEYEVIKTLSHQLDVSSYSVIEFKATRVRDGYSGKTKQIQKNMDYVLLSAIAKPEPLIKAWENLGANLSQKILLPDHHQFKESEWNQASKNGTVVCSGKDWVKLIPFLVKEGELLVIEQEVVDLSEPGEELLPWVRLQPVFKKSRPQNKPDLTIHNTIDKLPR